MTTKDYEDAFVQKAHFVHGAKYDYTKMDYKNSKTKVCIICPEHGEFWQTPRDHLKGSGCPQCAKEQRRIGETEFIQRANKTHNGKYDYSLVEYANNKTLVTIICPEHGKFKQRPYNHLQGQGCPKCAGHYMDADYFIEKSNKVHGGKYFYEKTNYIDYKTKVIITCPIHGDFLQSPNDHIVGCGCPKCKCDVYKNKESANNDLYGANKEDFYHAWKGMFKRCGNPKNPTYLDCFVCDKWNNLSAFREWYEANAIKGWAIDKDILFKGNKEYAPDKCCFVPQEINNLFVKCKKIRGKYPIGVKKGGKDSYYATIQQGNAKKHLGTFKTPEEAFQAYKVAKEVWIKEVADKWKDKLDPKVYKALYEYQVEITD